MRYCKHCKHNVQEKYLWNKEQCPTCGTKLPEPMVLTARRTKYVEKKFNIIVEYYDKVTGKEKSVCYTDITEEQYNKIKYSANNVIKVHTLTTSTPKEV